MRFLIENEYDRLEAVLVHRPGMEIDRLTHENMRRYLFEDVPYLKRMQKEHDGFVEAMRGRGIEVVYLEQLLLDVLKDDESRGEVIEEVCRTAMAPAIADDLFGLKHWGVEELVDVLFAGLTGEEYTARTGGRAVMAKSLAAGSEEAYLLQPIPNAYFSRDPAVVVGEAVISCKMHYRERVRESVLVRAVLERHPEYYDNLITYGGTDEPSEDRPFTIEGGDVIILSPEAVMVGASERTRSETIEMLAGNCFRLGDVKRVYEIPIPSERAFMHLDTVFTVVDRGMILWYSEVMEKVAYIHRYEPDEEDGEIVARRATEERGFVEVLADEFGCEVTVVETAGGRRQFASREQRTDGTNALAIGPRVVCTYERNQRTIDALAEHGVTSVVIDDSELVRGLGGPRCMTMPLRRNSAG